VAVVEGAPQAVLDHGVDEGAVAHAQTLTEAGHEVRGVAHRFHAPGNGNLDVTGRDALGREHHGLQAGSADLVDRQRRDVVGQSAVERRLARGVLAVACLDDVAHEAFVHARRIDAGASNGFAHGHGTELGSGEVLQGAEKPARGGPDGGEDDSVVHDYL
jgi:hypothetical protein